MSLRALFLQNKRTENAVLEHTGSPHAREAWMAKNIWKIVLCVGLLVPLSARFAGRPQRFRATIRRSPVCRLQLMAPARLMTS